jgi:hypothetical protein
VRGCARHGRARENGRDDGVDGPWLLATTVTEAVLFQPPL